MNIDLTDFAARNHFRKPDYAGTKVTSHSPGEFIELLSDLTSNTSSANGAEGPQTAPGYAPFCIHLFVPNFTDAPAGVAEITDANRHLLRSGYEARTSEELPVLKRWFDRADLDALAGPYQDFNPAPWLDIILYSRAHLEEEEGIVMPEGIEWGIVAILSASSPEEAPMTPITAMRNALGTEEGGSGVAIDRDYYTRAVAYWTKHATIR